MTGRTVAKRITKQLGLYDHIILAREKRNPNWVDQRRNDRDDRHLAAILAATLKPDSNAIDIGANVGGILRIIVRLAPSGRHVAFEPIPTLAADLARDYPGVEVHPAALSDHSGTAQFQWIEEMSAVSGLRLRADNTWQPTTIDVPLLRLDDVVQVPPSFVKIDVEGGEEAVLRGGQDTLERYQPLVAFEHGTPAASVFGTAPEAVYDLLPGFRIFDMDGNGPFSRDEFFEVVSVGARFNFVACPRR